MKEPHLKPKEEVLAELKKSPAWTKKMYFIKDKFYPALTKATKSIDDAQEFLSSIPTIIMQTVLESVKEKHLGEYNLISKLDPKDENYKNYCELIELFNDEKIFDARDLIEGMKNEISMFLKDEMKERKLDSLHTNWLDE